MQSILELKTQLNPEAWRRVVILGSGTSLLNLPKSAIPKMTTIALNDAILYGGCTCHFYPDQNLNHKYAQYPLSLARYVVTSRDNAAHLAKVPGYVDNGRLFWFKKEVAGDMYKCAVDNEHVWVDHTVATAAILFAWKMGAKEVYLVGADGIKLEYHRPDGHWFACYWNDHIEADGSFVRIPCHALYGTDIDIVVRYIACMGGEMTVYQTFPLSNSGLVKFCGLGELLDSIVTSEAA
jgi:hypothetical protein